MGAASPLFDASPPFKDGDRVLFVDHRGVEHRTRVYGMADSALYGPDHVHVWSDWLSILFVTVPASRLSHLPQEA